jgi:hypothetical protein
MPVVYFMTQLIATSQPWRIHPRPQAGASSAHFREAERDFSGLLAGFGRYVEGECTYCNHCLPCPVVIDIGQVNRLLDLAELGVTASLWAAYAALPVKASACTECGACTKRCPFGVDVMARMQQAIATFAA